MRDLAVLNDVRMSELGHVASWLPSGSRVLDVGAGTGAQAAALAARGHEVTALEVASERQTWTEYQDTAAYPLTFYDGTSLPFDDATFDVVFSSNVLEHVVDVQTLLAECQRVLPGDGRMVHVVPSASWRWWSMIAYYPAGVVKVFSKGGVAENTTVDGLSPSLIFPPVHGEKGNTVSELWWFTRWRWRSEFRQAGLDVVDERPVRIFHSGEWLTSMPIKWRRRLSRVLGASSRAFLLTARS